MDNINQCKWESCSTIAKSAVMGSSEKTVYFFLNFNFFAISLQYIQWIIRNAAD